VEELQAIAQLRPASPGFKNCGWRLEPFDEVQANDRSVSVWLLPPGSRGRPIAFLRCQVGMHGARGAEGSRSTRAVFLTKQNELFGNRFRARTGLQIDRSKYNPRWARHWRRLSPVSDGQLQNGALAQDRPLTRSRTTAADILTGLETPNVRTDSKESRSSVTNRPARTLTERKGRKSRRFHFPSPLLDSSRSLDAIYRI
jgi:hypothetical protein